MRTRLEQKMKFSGPIAGCSNLKTEDPTQATKKITGSGENRNDNLTTAQQHQSRFQWANKIMQVIDVEYNETPEKLKTWGFTVSEYTVLTNKDYLAGSWQPVKNNTTGTLFKFQQGPMSHSLMAACLGEKEIMSSCSGKIISLPIFPQIICSPSSLPQPWFSHHFPHWGDPTGLLPGFL